MDCSTTAMKRNIRPAPAIDWCVVGSIALFHDGIRRVLGYLWTPEGIFQGKFTVYLSVRSFANWSTSCVRWLPSRIYGKTLPPYEFRPRATQARLPPAGLPYSTGMGVHLAGALSTDSLEKLLIAGLSTALLKSPFPLLAPRPAARTAPAAST
jgi:hypothetical protein